VGHGGFRRGARDEEERAKGVAHAQRIRRSSAVPIDPAEPAPKTCPGSPAPATTATQALRYQLAACCAEGRIAAMVVADGDGLPLASSGDTYACDEVAARMVLVGARVGHADVTLFDGARSWDVHMQKVVVDGSELLVCAVGGDADARAEQIARGTAGALRILGAA
jgi:hypothetical protein